MSSSTEPCGPKALPGRLLWGVLCLLLLFPRGGRGAEESIDLSVGVRQEYTDNLFLDETDTAEDWFTTVTPGVALTRRSERVSARADGSLGVLHYQTHDGMDHVDQSYGGRVDVAATERLSMGGSVGYVRDSRPDRDLETTGLAFTDEVREHQTAQGNMGYQLTEKNSVGLTYAYTRDMYQESEENDYRGNEWAAYFSRTLSERFAVTVQTAYAAYDYRTAGIDNYALTVGGSGKLTETLSAVLKLGGRYTESVYDVQRLAYDPVTFLPYLAASELKTDDTGGVGEFSLSYAGEKITASAGVSHDIMAAGGRSEASERTGVTCAVDRRFTADLSGGVSAAWYLNRGTESAADSDKLDEWSASVRPWMQYRFSDALSLRMEYSAVLIRDEAEDETIRRNSAWAGLVWRHDLLD